MFSIRVMHIFDCEHNFFSFENHIEITAWIRPRSDRRPGWMVDDRKHGGSSVPHSRYRTCRVLPRGLLIFFTGTGRTTIIFHRHVVPRVAWPATTCVSRFIRNGSCHRTTDEPGSLLRTHTRDQGGRTLMIDGLRP